MFCSPAPRLAACLLFLLDLVFSYPVIPPITPLNHLTAGHFLCACDARRATAPCTHGGQLINE